MAPPRTAEHERCAGHPGTVSGDTAVERVTGIEPAWPAWKAGALPLSYARALWVTGAVLSLPAAGFILWGVCCGPARDMLAVA
jgi:hypothetical protein